MYTIYKKYTRKCKLYTFLVICIVLHRLFVPCRVQIDRADSRRQAETATRQTHYNHLQHGVQKGHPVPGPFQFPLVTYNSPSEADHKR